MSRLAGRGVHKPTFAAELQDRRRRMPAPFVHALRLVKQAAALVNTDLGEIDAHIGAAVANAAVAVVAGQHDAEFRLSSGKPAPAPSPT